MGERKFTKRPIIKRRARVNLHILFVRGIIYAREFYGDLPISRPPEISLFRFTLYIYIHVRLSLSVSPGLFFCISFSMTIARHARLLSLAVRMYMIRLELVAQPLLNEIGMLLAAVYIYIYNI